MVRTHNHLSSAKSAANNIGFRAGNSLVEDDQPDITPQSSKSALINALKSAMAEIFVNGFNLNNLFHVLSCIKHCEKFKFDSVMQDFWPCSQEYHCKMRIKFLGKENIQVSIFRGKELCSINAKTCPRTKKMHTLVDCVQIIELVYQTEL